MLYSEEHVVKQHAGPIVREGNPGAFRRSNTGELLVEKDLRNRLCERAPSHRACEVRDIHRRRRASTGGFEGDKG